jgi:Protein of unknown function, DUF547
VSFGTWRFDSSQPHLVEPEGIGEDDDSRLAYWLNAYNQTLREELAERPRSGHLFRHRRLFKRGAHRTGGLDYSLDVIEHGLLRGNKRPPYGLRPLLREGDPRLRAAPSAPDPRIHFALNCGARSCPPVRTYTAAGVDEELEAATRSYIRAESRLDREQGELELPGVVKLYRSDFGSDAELIELAAHYLDPDDAAWVREHAGDLRIGFARFDWQLVPGTHRSLSG